MAITFTNIPQNGASFNKALIYEFESDTDLEQVEIKIMDDTGAVIGDKIISGTITSGRIDIAPYVKRAATYNIPQSVAQCGLIDLGGSVKVIVEVEGTTSEQRSFLSADVEMGEEVIFLTDQMIKRVIAPDEFDVVGVINPTTTPLDIIIEICDDVYGCIMSRSLTISGQYRQYGICLTPQEFPTEILGFATYLLIKLRHGNRYLDVIEYEIRDNFSTAKRIGWINEHGAPEFYTFPLRKSLLVESTRKHMESLWGREAAALESDNELKMISAYEPQQQLQALAKILSSPKVWLQNSEGTQAVSLTTERALLTPGTGLGFIELDLRAAERGVKLW